MQLLLSTDEVAVHRVVGTETFLRGRQYAERGAVVRLQWSDRATKLFGQVRGSARQPYTALATLRTSRAGTLTSFAGTCTCPVRRNCKHAVALLLAAFQEDQLEPAPEWEQAFGGLLDAAAPQRPDEPAQVGLQFELTELTERSADGAADYGLRLRPVVPGRTGWVRTGISWSTLGYGSYSRPAASGAHLRLLEEILALSRADGHRSPYGYGGYYGSAPQTVALEDLSSRRVWDLLAEAQALGLPLVHVGRNPVPVEVATVPAEMRLTVSRSTAGLEVEPRITVDGQQVLSSASLLLGDPAHGIAWWQTPDEPAPRPKDRRLRLAALAAPLDAGLRTVLRRDAIRIPPQDEQRFLRDYYPSLRQRLPVVPADASVVLPEPSPPVLALTVEPQGKHRVLVGWGWSYGEGDEAAAEPLRSDPTTGGRRDAAAERDILAAVTDIARRLPDLLVDGPTGPRLAPTADLEGMATVRLATEVLPRLDGRPDVRVEVRGDLPAYRETDATPDIVIAGEQDAGERDWFDLQVTVSIDGEEVPYAQLFTALAAGDEHLLLPSGTYFRLDREELRQLANLIAEARALQDVPGETVRVSRFQASLWEDLERLGVISGQAAVWQQTVRELASTAGVVSQPVPAGLEATLRPYQRVGYDWLVFLFRHGLGGVLADDMGLGKTLQALALISHVREHRLSDAPFLVVAPTSVVPNWVAECRRFAPGLRAVAVTETCARRGSPLEFVASGADVVVTSYALFRLEYEKYAAVDWAGLVLDEAQFVKNHQSQGYQCAKKLPAPFKLAITGTPMENNLMELWSLLSITAPGLFASPTRFERYYRTPIEKGKDADLLAQLRRRIRPLMLRRSKKQVLTDLPAKQEQVIELPLNPKHRKVYQTHLARERQKVLGLLGDLDKNRFEIFRSLTLLRQASLHAGLIDPAYDGVPSTKLDALMEQLTDVVGDGHRTLVFSQFTRFLDAARQRLVAAGIHYCYLDGKTRNRGAVLSAFKSGAAPVFLISLKAGGFGLNLTEADYCILLDPWWNPATEAQAVDRIHRIGQTKKVMVYRLVAKDTIEEKVMALKASKAALFSSVMDGDGAQPAALTAADIRGLLA